ncbi:MAG: 23S rRNA (adenine(2503)-C(2))-methyltransferase RlmN [Alloprevotella sp.]|nr:23S rRNA (adenine(2503)-C(2))-methyltransferase RlmN [Alloprevotella sp.]
MSQDNSTSIETPRTLLGMSEEQLRDVALSLGLPRFAGKQIAQWLYGRAASRFEEMTNLSLAARSILAEHCRIGRSEPLDVKRSADGTAKYLFPTLSGHRVETVFIPDGERGTVCVSCQVGCKMGCRFCMTGRQGFQGQLTAADIVNQIISLPERDRLTNVVFMGQGEPMDNLEAVMAAIEVLTEPWGWAWSPRRITVSTVGIGTHGALRHFLNESRAHLAVSLHHPSHEGRLALMPAERAFPLNDTLALLREYDWSGQRRLTFEYTMLAGVNDTEVHAKALARLLRGLECRVNLIRFHRIPDAPFDGSSDAAIERFRDELNRRGITATIRASRGEDIWAACGLLNTAPSNLPPPGEASKAAKQK